MFKRFGNFFTLTLVSLVIFYSSAVYSQQLFQTLRPFEACGSLFPYGMPSYIHRHTNTEQSNTIDICRFAYALSYDTSARLPRWVGFTTNTRYALGCIDRNFSFVIDQSIPRGQQAEISDYAGTRYDIGHLADFSIMNWDIMSARESFILSNTSPQNLNLNRGAWRQLENAVRYWTLIAGPAGITVYTGPIYNSSSDRRIGLNRIVVPNSFYKIVINNTTRQTLAFIFQNSPVISFRDAQTTVQEIEQRSQIIFNVPDDKTILNEIWTINDSELRRARRNSCRHQ